MTFQKSKELKLEDCLRHGLASGAELFVVEGDSASIAVKVRRDPTFQAVLPMQGKPLNAVRAAGSKVGSNRQYRALIDTLGAGWGASFDLGKLRYDRVLLLMDPDADGIHCGALMLMFFYRWMRPMLDSGRIETVHAPMGEISHPGGAGRRFAYTEAQYRGLPDRPGGPDSPPVSKVRFRGLGGMEQRVLAETCLVPATRLASVMTAADAEKAIELFCMTAERLDWTQSRRGELKQGEFEFL